MYRYLCLYKLHSSTQHLNHYSALTEQYRNFLFKFVRKYANEQLDVSATFDECLLSTLNEN